MLLIARHIVPYQQKNQRFSDYACGIFLQIPSRKGVKKAIKKGEIRLNGEITESGRWVQEGDSIELVDLEQNPPKSYHYNLEVVYEDQHLAVVNKPAGVVVSGNQFFTLQNMLTENLLKSTEIDALKWPRPVHRLDKPTSGLLLVAKTKKAHMYLGHQFEQNTIQKTYFAIVAGTPPKNGTITTPIANQSAESSFHVVQSVPSLKSGTLSLVKLFPKSGRTHQLRIHMASIGHPIAGDVLYGIPGKTLLHQGLFLAAVGVQFIHPHNGEKLHIEKDVPHKFYSYLQREERRWKKYNS